MEFLKKRNKAFSYLYFISHFIINKLINILPFTNYFSVIKLEFPRDLRLNKVSNIEVIHRTKYNQTEAFILCLSLKVINGIRKYLPIIKLPT